MKDLSDFLFHGCITKILTGCLLWFYFVALAIVLGVLSILAGGGQQIFGKLLAIVK